MNKMRITCPQCHSRCRLKNDSEISDSSHGRCPECGHIFLIPPGANREVSTADQSLNHKQKKAGSKTSFQGSDTTTFRKPFQLSGRASLLWLGSAICLIVLLTITLIGPGKTSHPKVENKPAPSSSSTIVETVTNLTLDHQAGIKAIAQIKHHALVGDADISIADDHLQLALLVAGNTPVAYAERLGRQFVHYLKEQLTKTRQTPQKPAIQISVYYPGGTRIAVATNDQSSEEEVLPQMTDVNR
ncbi:MAG: hypothetical protein J7M09_00705 [Deltaproteobacteria bacterium]|nr:hypothetical protein [Candidatus Tharpella sp.]